MTRYRYTADHSAIIVGLSQGRGATVIRDHGEIPPDGATIEFRPGDLVDLDTDLDHPFLTREPEKPKARKLTDDAQEG